MRKFGLIGYPLGHSFSKKYFTDKFLKEHITSCIYENYPLQDLTKLPELLAKESDICGLNVTIPHKSGIIRFLDFIDPDAEEIGAVNVLKIKRVGGQVKMSGFNSDVTGIRDSLMPVINTSNVRNAIIFGTGGSSRAVVYVLRKLGLNITQVSRTQKDNFLTYSDLDSRIIKSSNLIINTTPLGMYPDTERKPEFNYDLLTREHILFDLVYNPEITSFLKMGKEKGCIILTGLKMLHSQAEKSWEIWNDKKL